MKIENCASSFNHSSCNLDFFVSNLYILMGNCD